MQYNSLYLLKYYNTHIYHLWHVRVGNISITRRSDKPDSESGLEGLVKKYLNLIKLIKI